MSDYNEGGVEYECFMQQMHAGVGGYMSDVAVERKMALGQAIIKTAEKASLHGMLRAYLGVLHHLDAFLLSVERIVEQMEFLKKNILSEQATLEFPKIVVRKSGQIGPLNSPPCLIGISSTLIEIELETLLLRGVSLLERISKQIENELALPPAKSFYQLESQLRGFKGDDERAPPLLKLVSGSKSDFGGLILSVDNKTSLRNIVAHRASAPEIMDKGFSINWVDDETLLAFDAELERFPVIGSVRALAKSVPFFAMNCLKILLSSKDEGMPVRVWADSSSFSEGDFEPTWKNPFIHFSSMIDPTSQGPLVSLVRWLPGGFQTHQRHLRNEVFDFSAKPIRS